MTEFKENQGPPKFTPLFEAGIQAALDQTAKGMAHMVDLERTDNARCRTCKHFVQAKTRTAKGELRDGQCAEWKRQMGERAGRSWPKTKHAQRACKYHDPAENPPPSHVRVSTHG